MGRADLGVLLTSSLQHTALEYLPLWTGELLLAVPEGHSEFSQKDITPAISMASGATILFLPALPPTDGTVKNRHCA